MTSIYDWSATPASNATVGSINFAESQLPSTLNDSNRQAMADVAAWRDFLGGAKISSGTDTITLTSGLSLSAYAQGQLFAFEAGGANTGAVTLNVDSVGAKAIVKYHDVALIAGDIEAGGIYVVAYEATADNFQLLSPVSNAPGTGDTSGPGSSTDNAIPKFDGTGGKTLQNSGVVIDDDDNLSGHGAEVNAQTGTTYTALGSDNGKVVTLNNASTVALTLPQTTTETIAAGWQATFVQLGAGSVTIDIEGSDTQNGAATQLTLTGQYSAVTIIKLTAGSPNAYLVVGDFS